MIEPVPIRNVADPGVVDLLRTALELAEQGQLRNVAVVAHMLASEVFIAFEVPADSNAFSLVGGLVQAQARILEVATKPA